MENLKYTEHLEQVGSGGEISSDSQGEFKAGVSSPNSGLTSVWVHDLERRRYSGMVKAITVSPYPFHEHFFCSGNQRNEDEIIVFKELKSIRN